MLNLGSVDVDVGIQEFLFLVRVPVFQSDFYSFGGFDFTYLVGHRRSCKGCRKRNLVCLNLTRTRDSTFFISKSDERLKCVAPNELDMVC